ncbi:MAG: hypothetical protein AVDCRST_MAG67-2853, partial [uncultured Solirubrobacteraceae bacterium]
VHPPAGLRRLDARNTRAKRGRTDRPRSRRSRERGSCLCKTACGWRQLANLPL